VRWSGACRRHAGLGGINEEKLALWPRRLRPWAARSGVQTGCIQPGSSNPGPKRCRALRQVNPRQPMRHHPRHSELMSMKRGMGSVLSHQILTGDISDQAVLRPMIRIVGEDCEHGQLGGFRTQGKPSRPAIFVATDPWRGVSCLAVDHHAGHVHNSSPAILDHGRSTAWVRRYARSD